MSLVHLANLCSHLQNASRARLGLTSLPLSTLHLKLCLGLQKEGFISSVQIGGPAPPVLHPELAPSEETTAEAATKLAAEPWLAFPTEDVSPLHPVEAVEEVVAGSIVARLKELHAMPATSAPPPSEPLSTHHQIPTNPSKRRLWVGLKYWQNEPVLRRMALVSKPTRRIWMNSTDIGDISRGKRAGFVDGLTKPGECLFVSTDQGIMESRECAEKRVGGMLLCKVV